MAVGERSDGANSGWLPVARLSPCSLTATILSRSNVNRVCQPTRPTWLSLSSLLLSTPLTLFRPCFASYQRHTLRVPVIIFSPYKLKRMRLPFSYSNPPRERRLHRSWNAFVDVHSYSSRNKIIYYTIIVARSMFVISILSVNNRRTRCGKMNNVGNDTRFTLGSRSRSIIRRIEQESR